MDLDPRSMTRNELIAEVVKWRALGLRDVEFLLAGIQYARCEEAEKVLRSAESLLGFYKEFPPKNEFGKKVVNLLAERHATSRLGHLVDMTRAENEKVSRDLRRAHGLDQEPQEKSA